MKESTPTFPLNPLRWIQKRAKDYWKYTKANPLKSLVMTGTALLGIGLCVAGTIFTLGVASCRTGRYGARCGGTVGVGIGALGSDIRRQTQEEEMKNLSPKKSYKNSRN